MLSLDDQDRFAHQNIVYSPQNNIQFIRMMLSKTSITISGFKSNSYLLNDSGEGLWRLQHSRSRGPSWGQCKCRGTNAKGQF